MIANTRLTVALVALICSAGWAQAFDIAGLSKLTPGRVRAENALWVETPLEKRFDSSKEVVIADLKGPATINMIHFAVSHRYARTKGEKQIGREVLIQIYWDGETEPSVNCPLVDFFCDPAGLRKQVNTALLNKRRGYNAYFPMPFRKSAKIVLVYQGPTEPGEKLRRMMPCYSYVIYRTLDKLPADEGYFHACWRQEALLLGKKPYLAMQAKGKGKFVGWNVTLRRPGQHHHHVDMNENFFIDGEQKPSVEFMGIEDSFGYSWGFPTTENIFPLTGYWPFIDGHGSVAYRFFINDAISFQKSLKLNIAFGENENLDFKGMHSQPGSELQISSTCYWYQTEPHATFPPMPGPDQRKPAPDDRFWLHKEKIPSAQEIQTRNLKLYMLCGRPEKEIIVAEPGFNAVTRQGRAWNGWALPVYHCRSDEHELRIALTVPEASTGKLRIYIIDPDSFQGGRRQQVLVDDRDLGEFADFQKGRWIETPIDSDMTGDGQLIIRAKNLNQGSNAAISIIEWLNPK
ncbi:MAG: glycoside hydrolase family 172 protein [Planctomycetota bacterium]|jgi:hypothetical protein